ncbi:MAG TPA: proton-conducting transporter membrane subunit [Pseudomonas sp.]|nr:proton-conducting transporter membrane subunit [Pseudomonas sp.]
MLAAVTTTGGLLLVLAVLVPFLGVLLGFVLGAGNARRVALATLVLGLVISMAGAAVFLQTGADLVYLLGGWTPPLGIALRADGLSVTMLVTVAVVINIIGIYACADFPCPSDAPAARKPFVFWLLLLAVWGALNLVFVSGDLFTLYVALELLTFAGVPLVCLDGGGDTLRAALRYLLFALVGSMLYLLGAVLLYGAYGTLDIALLGAAVRPGPVTWTVLALMTCGLLAKTALFPLHLWLPPAHAGAPAAASAVLSALVIKGSWFLVVRLWFDVMPGVVTFSAAQLLGALGAAAIVAGSVVALRQQRLKLLVAYSTIAQIGYLFLMFPLAFDIDSGALVQGAALHGGLLQAVSHATAKASMFMAAGLVYAALGHDRLADMAGVARAMPVTVLAFVLAGIALMGVLPSGAYLAKKLMLDAAVGSGQWWWSIVLQGGAVFTAGYVVLVLRSVLSKGSAEPLCARAVSRRSEYAALSLALISLALAAVTLGPVSVDLLSGALEPKELLTLLLVLAGGILLMQGLAPVALRNSPGSTPSGLRSLQRAMFSVGVIFEQGDLLLRRWTAASICLLALAALFGVLLFYGSLT